jgi:uncharacterized membrane protein
MMLPGWHPAVVHFPLALVVSSALFLSAARILPRQSHAATLAIVGTWNLCVGAVAALFALATGLAATAALMVTGYRGGQNVYRYGVGVQDRIAASATAR